MKTVRECGDGGARQVGRHVEGSPFVKGDTPNHTRHPHNRLPWAHLLHSPVHAVPYIKTTCFVVLGHHQPTFIESSDRDGLSLGWASTALPGCSRSLFFSDTIISLNASSPPRYIFSQEPQAALDSNARLSNSMRWPLIGSTLSAWHQSDQRRLYNA